MKHKNSSITQPTHPALLVKPVLLGAGIALTLITAFLLQVRFPKPEWGQLWMIKPLIIVPLAGASGGVLFYFINNLRSYQSGWRKALAIIFSLIVYLFTLWIGTVLGLNGTLWN